MLHFPVILQAGPLRIHPHWVFEALAYTTGFQLYLRNRRRAGDFLPWIERGWVVAAAIMGAAIGSKILYLFEDPYATWGHRADILFLMGGKTVVGGLLGGWIAVEWAKKMLNIERRTGDLFAIPLAIGMTVGRIGCFLAGLEDHTFGTQTWLPWGVDFGDGIPRHPAQLYECGFLLLLALFLQLRPPRFEGDSFRTFMAAYLSFRLLVDYLKPAVPLGGLTAIQWVCVATLIYISGKEARKHG